MSGDPHYLTIGGPIDILIGIVWGVLVLALFWRILRQPPQLASPLQSTQRSSPMAETSITREMIEAAAAAIANARGGRRGAPEINNILRVLPQKLRDEVLEDAEEALKAAFAVRGGARA